MLEVLLLVIAVAVLALALGLRRSSSAVRRRWFLAALGAGLILLAAWAVVAGEYDVRKVAGLLLMPAGLVWVGWAALAWQLAGRGRRRLAVTAWALWLAFTLAGNVWVGRALMGWLEHGYDTVDPVRLERFDAVLVLGGGLTRHDHGQVYLGDAGDRVMLAARLYLSGKTDYLIASGPWLADPGQPPTSVPALTAQAWQDLDIPTERIVLLEGPRTTSAEIVELERLLAARRWQRIGLLTSAYHLRRATGLCRRRGIEVTPLPADFASSHTAPQPMHLVPQGDGFNNVQRACWELLGAAVGR